MWEIFGFTPIFSAGILFVAYSDLQNADILNVTNIVSSVFFFIFFIFFFFIVLELISGNKPLHANQSI